jgi:archaellum component FlaG (FlaF/FlaG flagellin family)
VSAALVGVFFTSVTQISDSIQQSAGRSAAELESSVEILNDPAHVAYNNTSQTFTLWVKNTGARPLPVNSTVVFIDNRSFANNSFSAAFVGALTVWAPQVTVQFQVNGVDLTAGSDHFMQVVAQAGATDSQEFFY